MASPTRGLPLLLALGLTAPYSTCKVLRKPSKMELVASVLPCNSEPLKQHAITTDPSSRNHEDQEAWKQLVSKFRAQVLDASYLSYPIRANTIETAALYPKTIDNGSPTLLPGTHKHLGGAYDPTDGCIYGVPANARSILCLYPNKDRSDYQMTCIPLPPSVAQVRMKWLRGIVHDGHLWAIPSGAPGVLCVDLDAFWGRRMLPAGVNNVVQLVPLPPQHRPSAWQWHGAGLNADKTAAYCIPSNAEYVLKVDLQQKKTSLIEIKYDPAIYSDFDLSLPNKWYGGIAGRDNCVYGVPYRASAVLQIDCAHDRARLVGPNYGCHGYNWHGGIQVQGKIFAHPSHAPDTVLVIDTNPNRTGDDKLCYELPIQRATDDTDPRQNYKWLGGSLGADGSTVFCPACDTSAVLKIDTRTETCVTFGDTGRNMKNKWQGGVRSSRDGCVYCIPASGTHVCRIATAKDAADAVQLLGPLPAHKDKWQGGHEGVDGCLYFIPENGYRVLKVVPPSTPPVIVNGAFVTDEDVQLVML